MKSTVWLLALLLGNRIFLVSEKTDPEFPTAESIISAYNGRDFGAPGSRTVTLSLVNNHKTVKTFRVCNFWMREGNSVKTIFYLKEPLALSGTSYLLTEEASSPAEMRVDLFLPSGKRKVTKILPYYFDQGLLGSDFGYTDLKMLISTDHYKFITIGENSIEGHPVWKVEATPLVVDGKSVSWDHASLYFAKKFPFLLGADYYKDGQSVPYKQYRIKEIKSVDGIYTATKMQMSAGDGQYSLLTLDDASFRNGKVSNTLFTAAGLPYLNEKLKPFLK